MKNILEVDCHLNVWFNLADFNLLGLMFRLMLPCNMVSQSVPRAESK